ncbi:MAG: NAD(P)H-binding protein, partial [Thermaerobacter sp.]|nr:NAD(P)H-binding protein [Thermaerobacter sp.]
GFLGQEVSRRLMALGYRVMGLVRTIPEDLAVVPLLGNLLEPDPFQGPDLVCDAFIHCAGNHPGEAVDLGGLHESGTARAIAEARTRGIRRFIHISVIGASPDAPTRFQRSKWASEELVRRSDLEWTILRPHLMFGQGSRTFHQLERAAAKPWAVLPESRVLLQPIYVGDVAELAIRSLWLPRTVGEAYDIAGPHSMRLEDIVRHIARDLHWFRIWTIQIPKKYAYQMLSWVGRSSPILRGTEWEFLQHEVPPQSPQWLTDYGLLPHSLAMFYSPLS